jgi:type I restriction enzyme S subunit
MEVTEDATQANSDAISPGWHRKFLGEICGRITTGKLDANAMVSDGDFPFFTCAREPYRIDTYAFDDEALLVSGNGANVGYVHYFNGKFNAYQRTYVLTNFAADVQFMKHFLERNLKERIRVEVNAGNTPYITMGTLTQMEVFLPQRFSEQQSIATALSDADAYIVSLEQLITKKHHIKQGVMQELLTGKRRLPGFETPWESVTLGEVAHIKTGSKNNEDKAADGQYPFFVRSDFVERINSYSYDCEAILVPGEGRIGEIFHYIKGRFDVHQRVYAITGFSPKVSGKFVFFYLQQHFGKWALVNTVKATVDSLRLPTFINFEMRLPRHYEEQVQIAGLISDLEQELTCLCSRFLKAKLLKQAMMQQLLTGRIRLV